MHKYGAAVQSAVYRTTLLAVLASPLMILVFPQSGIYGWSIPDWKSASFIVTPPGNANPGIAESRLVSSRRQTQVAEENVHHVEPELADGEGSDSQLHGLSATDRTSATLQAPTRTQADGQASIDRVAFIALTANILWFSTSLLLVLRMCWAWRQLEKLCLTAHLPDARTIEICNESAKWMNVSPPAVLRSPFLTSPCLVGIRSPVVLLPADERGRSLREVILHELAHLRRNDCLWKFGCRITTTLFFFQPLLWLLARRMEVVAEEVCDDVVLEFGGNREQYAHCLVDIAELNTCPAAPASVGIVSLQSILSRRVARVLDQSRQLSTRVGNRVAIAVVFGGALVAGVAGLVGTAPRPAAQANETLHRSTEESEANDVPEVPSQSVAETVIVGQVTDSDGRPVPNASVAAFATPRRLKVHADPILDNFALSESTTDDQGNYQLEFSEVTSRTHGGGFVIARKAGNAMAWKPLNLDDHLANLSLSMKRETPIRGRLVDLQGQPADRVELRVASVSKRSPNQQPRIYAPYLFDVAPVAWLPTVRSDPMGRFTIHGVAPEYGVRLSVVGGERFAMQEISLNTGESEERRHEQGYHQLVRNVAAGEEALLPLAPAQFLEGTVTYEDNDLAVPFAQVEVICRQHKFGTGRVVSGKADENGEYRISAAPGAYFSITALPPSGEPYLVRQTPFEDTIIWRGGDVSRRVDITLPRGVLVHGKVVEAESGEPIGRATIQYEPERFNNPNTSDDIGTGSRTRQVSDDFGHFEIGVLPGAGRLLVHGPDGKYVSKVFGSRELVFGKPGGVRQFVNGWKRISPAKETEHLEVKVDLQLGSRARGRLTDESGELIEEARAVSLLTAGSSHSLTWGNIPKLLGGNFEFSNLEAGRVYPVHFLDEKRRLGTTIQLQASPAPLSVVLRACGEARARIVDEKGQPRSGARVGIEVVLTPGPHRVERAAAKRGELFAVTAHAQQVDSTNYSPLPRTDDRGVITFPALIPGATYRILTFENQTVPNVQAEFAVESGQSIDLGDLAIPKGSQTYVLR